MAEHKNRAPWVRFELREVEDRTASLAAGKYIAKDEAYIVIVPHGSEGKTKIEESYASWLQKMRKTPYGAMSAPGDAPNIMEARFEDDWIDRIVKAHDNWIAGTMMEVTGTPLQNWPVLTPAQRTACMNVHVLSVEELADATDQCVDAIGAGGRNLRQRAKDWVAASTDAGKTAATLEKLRVDNQNKDTRIESLESQVQALQQKMSELGASGKPITKALAAA